VNPELVSKPLLTEAVEIWYSGGWGMYALAVNGFILYAMAVSLMLRLLSRGIYTNPERVWRQWQAGKANPRKGAVRILEGTRTLHTLEEVEAYFGLVRAEELMPFARDLRFIKVTVSTAPLLGLLGTVTGMFSTFQALAGGSGGAKTMDMVASGISEALITTETGLVMALSGLVFQFMLGRMHNQYNRLVTHLETLSMQDVLKNILPEAA
jgi:biopolymer transport protein ExbB